MEQYKIYTDGAVSKNGQEGAVGGWAFLIIDKQENHVYSYCNSQVGATNQQMELTAIIRACEYAEKNLPVPESDFAIDTIFTIMSDSAYVINCYKQKWWENWQVNGWRNAKKEPVANKELWLRLIPFFKNHKFNFVKVAGHSSDKWNDYVDKLAVSARLS